MKDFSREMKSLAIKCEFAEEWRYHNPLGLCDTDANPLKNILHEHII